MKNEPKLSVFGWLIILAIFAGLGYWYSLPIKPLTSLVNDAQFILKGIVFVTLIVYQWTVFDEYDPRNNNGKSIAVSLLMPALIQLIALFGLIRTEGYVTDALGLQGLVIFLYALIVAGMATVYAIIILIVGFSGVSTLCKSISVMVRHPEQSNTLLTKLLFKQEKPVEKVKM